jgi:hypothetical protein
VLFLLLEDGGQLETREIQEALFPWASPKHALNKLESLRRRGLVNKEIVQAASRDKRRHQPARANNRSYKTALWSIRVAREGVRG